MLLSSSKPQSSRGLVVLSIVWDYSKDISSKDPQTHIYPLLRTGVLVKLEECRRYLLRPQSPRDSNFP